MFVDNSLSIRHYPQYPIWLSPHSIAAACLRILSVVSSAGGEPVCGGLSLCQCLGLFLRILSHLWSHHSSNERSP